MSYTVKLVQQRPNTGVEFFNPSEAVINKLEEYKSLGKIISYDLLSTSADQLVRTLSVVYNSIEDYTSAINEDVFVESASLRELYCDDNSISWSVEQVE